MMLRGIGRMDGLILDGIGLFFIGVREWSGQWRFACAGAL